PDEAAAPDGLVAERLRVEASGQLAAITQPDADALGDDHPCAAEHAAQDAAEIGPVPAAVLPGLIALVAPVSLSSTVETRERWQERGHDRLVAEILRFLGVEIVDAIAIDRVLPARPVLRVQRCPVVGEF